MPWHEANAFFSDNANFVSVSLRSSPIAVVAVRFLYIINIYDVPPYLNPTTKGLIAHITM